MKGKTASGFAFSVDETVLDDMRVVDAIAEIESGANPAAISTLLNRILGKEQKERLYEHIEENGRVPVKKTVDEIVEIFQALGGQGKNS